MASYGAGVQGGKSLLAPKYTINTYTTIVGNDLFAPGTAFEFSRVTGPQKIVMTYVDDLPHPPPFQPPSWVFYITGGSNFSGSQITPSSFGSLTSNTFPGTINYTPDDFPPLGCTVVEQPRPSSNTTRINVFLVTEFVTGFNLQFILAWSPFCSVAPLIMIAPGTPAPIGFQQVEMDIFFYRTPPTMRMSGTPSSFGAPEYTYKSFDTLFPAATIYDGAAHPFRRYNGQQSIVVSDVGTNNFFSFEMDFGIIGQANGYIGFISPTANGSAVQAQIPSMNCTVTNLPSGSPHSVVQIEQFQIIDWAGRTFIFSFDPNPYTQNLPTIRFVGGAILANDILVQSTYVKFWSL